MANGGSSDCLSGGEQYGLIAQTCGEEKTCRKGVKDEWKGKLE